MSSALDLKTPGGQDADIRVESVSDTELSPVGRARHVTRTPQNAVQPSSATSAFQPASAHPFTPIHGRLDYSKRYLSIGVANFRIYAWGWGGIAGDGRPVGLRLAPFSKRLRCAAADATWAALPRPPVCRFCRAFAHWITKGHKLSTRGGWCFGGDSGAVGARRRDTTVASPEASVCELFGRRAWPHRHSHTCRQPAAPAVAAMQYSTRSLHLTCSWLSGGAVGFVVCGGGMAVCESWCWLTW